jgi:Protein of unknown function (DUF1353)
MEPTLIQTCSYKPVPDSDTDVWLTIDADRREVPFPEYALVYEDDEIWMGIKPHFRSDGVSVPRLVYTITGLTPFDKRTVFGAFLHDGIYQSHLLPQYKADCILDTVWQIKPRVNWAQRNIAYYTLRSVGHIAYNRKTEKEIETAKQFVTVIEKQKLQMGFVLR